MRGVAAVPLKQPQISDGGFKLMVETLTRGVPTSLERVSNATAAAVGEVFRDLLCHDCTITSLSLLLKAIRSEFLSQMICGARNW